MQKKKLVRWITAFTAFALAVIVPTQAMATTPRIALSPVSTTLAPGQTQAVTITLDNPIVCQSGTCDVVLDFSASQTLGVTMTPSVITFLPSNWFTPQTVTVAFDLNHSAQYPQVVTLAAVAASNSEYYRGFRVGFPVTLSVPDIRPPVVEVVDPTLANTGAPINNLEFVSLIGVSSVSAGLAVMLYVRRNKKLMRRSSR